MKFLEPKPKKARASTSEEDGVDGEAAAVEDASFIVERAEDASDRVKKFIATADSFALCFTTAPKSVTEWKEMADDALTKAPACPHIGRGKKYMRRWHVRMYLLCRMQEQGVATLKIGKGTSLNSVVSLNPDETDCMSRLRSHLKQQAWQAGKTLTATGFTQGLGAKRIELASMWTCFSMDVGFQEEDFESFDEAEWSKVAQEMKDDTGVSPHLAVGDPA